MQDFSDAKLARTEEKGHGRIEIRNLSVIDKKPALDLGFPYAQQIFRIKRERFDLSGELISEEITYGLTSMSGLKVSPERLMQGIREHWHIENCDHHVKDVTLGEDASRVRLPRSAQILALLRNLTLNILRRLGFYNIAEGIRTLGFGSRKLVLRIIGIKK
jgi:predicted transposase YbfD/YdcC